MNFFSKNKDIKFVEYLNKKSYVKRLTQFIIGCFIVAFSYNVFIASNDLVPGGVGGIAVVINNLVGIDYSISIFVLNFVLIIFSLIFLGVGKTKTSILGTMLFPIFVALTEHINVWLEIDTSHILLSAIFGGILYGFGAGLVFKAGFTTGGTDILNQIVSKYAKLSLGKSMLCTDGLIVLSSGLFFGINSMMYSIIILYMISLISDRVVLGISDSKVFYIVTEKEEEVREFVINYLHHGITVFKAKGGRHNKNEDVLMTVLPSKDYYRLKEGLKAIDKDAFFIVTDTYEVFGGE